MKQVFSSHQEVCHVWASQSQTTGRAGNISFNGSDILSYHYWLMAKFINPNLVLIRNYPYSISTAKHLNRVRRVIASGIEIFDCNTPDGYSHSVNIADYLKKIKESASKFKTARTNKDWYLRVNKSLINKLKRYCELFEKKIPSFIDLNTPENLLLIEKQAERTKELERKQSERFERIKADNKKEVERIENDWFACKSNQTGLYLKNGRQSIILHFTETRLRVKDNQVETSRGAKVPVESAKVLWQLIKNGRDVKGFQIGYYTVISLNGVLKIGCHEISRDEIKRFTEFYNW